jgi:hypothetical protein
MLIEGSKKDNEQESIEAEVIGLDLNIDQATVTYLAYDMALKNTNQTLEYLKDIRTTPPTEWPEGLIPENINEHVSIAKYTKEKLTYLIDEVKQIMLELDIEEKAIIKKPKWGK